MLLREMAGLDFIVASSDTAKGAGQASDGHISKRARFGYGGLLSNTREDFLYGLINGTPTRKACDGSGDAGCGWIPHRFKEDLCATSDAAEELIMVDQGCVQVDPAFGSFLTSVDHILGRQDSRCFQSDAHNHAFSDAQSIMRSSSLYSHSPCSIFGSQSAVVNAHEAVLMNIEDGADDARRSTAAVCRAQDGTHDAQYPSAGAPREADGQTGQDWQLLGGFDGQAVSPMGSVFEGWTRKGRRVEETDGRNGCRDERDKRMTNVPEIGVVPCMSAGELESRAAGVFPERHNEEEDEGIVTNALARLSSDRFVEVIKNAVRVRKGTLQLSLVHDLQSFLEDFSTTLAGGSLKKHEVRDVAISKVAVDISSEAEEMIVLGVSDGWDEETVIAETEAVETVTCETERVTKSAAIAEPCMDNLRGKETPIILIGDDADSSGVHGGSICLSVDPCDGDDLCSDYEVVDEQDCVAHQSLVRARDGVQAANCTEAHATHAPSSLRDSTSCRKRRRKWAEENRYGEAQEQMATVGDGGKSAPCAAAAAVVESDSDDDVQVVYAKGPVATRDWPHMRFDCGVCAFTGGQGRKETKMNEGFCAKCYCFVCGVEASQCKTWKDPDGKHCNAEGKNSYWEGLKKTRSLVKGLASGDLIKLAKDKDELMSHVDKFVRTGEAPQDADENEISDMENCSCTCTVAGQASIFCTCECPCHGHSSGWHYGFTTSVDPMDWIGGYMKENDPGSALALLEVITKLVGSEDAHMLRGYNGDDALKKLWETWVDVLLHLDVTKDVRDLALSFLQKMKADSAEHHRPSDSSRKIAMRAARVGWEKPQLVDVLVGHRPVIAEPLLIVKARMRALEAAGLWDEALRYVRAVSIIDESGTETQGGESFMKEPWKVKLLCKMKRFSEVLHLLQEEGSVNVWTGLDMESIILEMLEQDVDTAVAMTAKMFSSGQCQDTAAIHLTQALCIKLGRTQATFSATGPSHEKVEIAHYDAVKDYNAALLKESRRWTKSSSPFPHSPIIICLPEDPLRRCSSCRAADSVTETSSTCVRLRLRGKMASCDMTAAERDEVVITASEVPSLRELAGKVLAERLIRKGAMMDPKIASDVLDKVGDSTAAFFTRLYMLVYALGESVTPTTLSVCFLVVDTLQECRQYGMALTLACMMYKKRLEMYVMDSKSLWKLKFYLGNLLPWEGPNPSEKGVLSVARLEIMFAALLIQVIQEVEEPLHHKAGVRVDVGVEVLKEFRSLSARMMYADCVKCALELIIAMIRYEDRLADLCKARNMGCFEVPYHGVMAEMASRLTGVQSRRLGAVHLQTRNLSRKKLLSFVWSFMNRPDRDCIGIVLRVAVKALAPSTPGDLSALETKVVEALLDHLTTYFASTESDVGQTLADASALEGFRSSGVSAVSEEQERRGVLLPGRVAFAQELTQSLLNFTFDPSWRAYTFVRDTFILNEGDPKEGTRLWRESSTRLQLQKFYEKAVSSTDGSEVVKNVALHIFCSENDVDLVAKTLAALGPALEFGTLFASLKICEECCARGESRQDIVRHLVNATSLIWDAPSTGVKSQMPALRGHVVLSHDRVSDLLGRVVTIHPSAALDVTGHWLDGMKNAYLKRTMTAKVREEFRRNLLHLKDMVAAVCKDDAQMVWKWVLYSTGILFRAKPAVHKVLSLDAELNRPLGDPVPLMGEGSNGSSSSIDGIPLPFQRCTTLQEVVELLNAGTREPLPGCSPSSSFLPQDPLEQFTEAGQSTVKEVVSVMEEEG